MNDFKKTSIEEIPRKKSGLFRKFLVGLIVIFLGLQLVPVNRHNPEVVADIKAPDDVRHILKRACYDCHSNETKWPWYSYIAPGSWLVAKDVREGRERLNFSEWGEYYDEFDTPLFFVEEGCMETIHTGEMPLWFYVPMHPEAELSEEDMAVLEEWCGDYIVEEEPTDEDEVADEISAELAEDES